MRSVLLIAFTTTQFALTGGHVVLETPTPFLPAEDGPTNPNTAETFPCKVPSNGKLVVNGSATEIAIGEDQPLTFNGHAVHSGGSCQISITSDHTDWQVTKSSRFKVIHSLEGGCPARNVRGNLDGPNTDVYHFQIPAGVVPGEYVLGWSWVPRSGGQPEYYMNCAPIVVKPAKAKRRSPMTRRDLSLAKRDAFPDIFMANLGDLTGGCTTGTAMYNQVAVAYPKPGSSIERPDGAEELFAQPCDGNPYNNGTATSNSSATATSDASVISSSVVSRNSSASSVATRSLVTGITSTVLLSLPFTASSVTKSKTARSTLSAVSAAAAFPSAVESVKCSCTQRK